jgi:hypothetical protein
MTRYFDPIIKTAGLHNIAGCNIDTRSIPSPLARHDVWRRAVSNWLASLPVRGIVDMDHAEEMALEAAYGLDKGVYRFSGRRPVFSVLPTGVLRPRSLAYAPTTLMPKESLAPVLHVRAGLYWP